MSILSVRSFSEELRRRFVKSETMLFRIRYELADQNEVNQFLESKKFAWEKVRASSLYMVLKHAHPNDRPPTPSCSRSRASSSPCTQGYHGQTMEARLHTTR